MKTWSIRPSLSQAGLDLLHVQADEIRVKARSLVAWMGLAMMVSTRLWLGGVVSQTRDTRLSDRLLQQVRACCLAAREVLICTDGWAAYPGSIRRAFRDKVKRTPGRGRAQLQIWPGLHIGTVIKHTVNKRLAFSGVSDEPREPGTGVVPLAPLRRRTGAEHGIHRALQWDDT